MVVGVSVVHVMVLCGPVRRTGWVGFGARLCWGVVVSEPLGVAVASGHQGVGFRGGGGVLVPLVLPRSLALLRWRPLRGVDLCRQRSLIGPPSRDAMVQRWFRALGRVLQVVWIGAFEVGWCDPAGPGSRLGCRTLLAGAPAGPSARHGLHGLVGVGGRWSPLPPRG